MVYHKINDSTSIIACGENPDEVVFTEGWERTTCKKCLEIKKKGRLVYARKCGKTEGKKFLPRVTFAKFTYGKKIEEKIRNSLNRKFKTKEPKRLKFGDTYHMPNLVF